MTIRGVLCHLIRNGNLLLIKKSRGFGQGYWNAPGGRLLPNETPTEATKREVYEETGMQVERLELAAEIEFYTESNEVPEWLVYVFRCNSFSGSIREGAEGKVKWFSTHDIPYDEMWEDDRHWLPRLLEGRKFRGSFYFTKNFGKLLRFDLVED